MSSYEVHDDIIWAYFHKDDLTWVENRIWAPLAWMFDQLGWDTPMNFFKKLAFDRAWVRLGFPKPWED